MTPEESKSDLQETYEAWLEETDKVVSKETFCDFLKIEIESKMKEVYLEERNRSLRVQLFGPTELKGKVYGISNVLD